VLLAGCSTHPVARPVTVEVPVPVSCRVPAILHPVWPSQALDGHEPLLDQVKALLAENELRQAYEVQIEAALQACQ
jgi:hypothetical protein